MTASIYNPEPIILEESEKIESDFLSPLKLQHICGSANLNVVESIDIIINTKETTVGNFGQFLPALKNLNLNGSVIPSIRNIGTSFNSLTVLLMCHCHLCDVDGIGALPNLHELFLSDNLIFDISPISFLDNLKVLDIKENKIVDLEQIDYLAFLPDLVSLFLSDNPICLSWKNNHTESLTDYLLSKVPSLKHINGVSLNIKIVKAYNSSSAVTDSHFDHNLEKDNTCSREVNNDVITKNYFQSNSLSEGQQLVSVRATRTRPLSARLTSNILLDYGTSGSAQSKVSTDDTSFLTFGSPLCGNPMQALKERKKFPVSPVVAMLTKENTVIDKSPRPRPTTASTLFRRSFKVINDDQLETLQINFRNIFKSQKEADTTAKTDQNYFITPSPPKKTSYNLPSPPKSSQRPKTSQGFRSRKFRRSIISKPSQSLDIVADRNMAVENQPKSISASLDDRIS